MANLNDIVKVTQKQYENLLGGGTVSGQTYDENSIYLVDEDTNLYEELLWVNPSPGVEYAGGSSIYFDDLLQYDYIKIGYRYHITDKTGTQYLTVKPSNSGGYVLSSANIHSSGENSTSRQFSMTGTSITFQGAYYVNHDATAPTSGNNFLIPTEIIGVKMGKEVQAADNNILLWENPSPNTSWTDTSAQSLNRNMNDFRYIIFEWKPYAGSNYLRETTVFKNPRYGTTDVVSSGSSICYLSKMTQTSTTTHMCRYVNSNGTNTAVIFANAYKNTSSDNSCIIPTAIYGCNDLNSTYLDSPLTKVYTLEFTSSSGGGSLGVPNVDYIISVNYLDDNNNWVYAVPESHSFYITNYGALYYYKVSTATNRQIRIVYKTK